MTEKAVSKEIAKASDQLKVLQKAGDGMIFRAEVMEVENASTLESARGVLRQIADINKKITAFVKPVKKAFKLYVDSLGAGAKKAEGMVREKINNYAIEEERKRQEAEAVLRKQQEAMAAQARAEADKIREQQLKDNPEIPLPPPPPVFVPPPVSLTSTIGSGFRTYWKHRIVDEKLIPEKYWLHIIDEKQIAADVTAQKENFREPGIETYTEKKVAVG